MGVLRLRDGEVHRVVQRQAELLAQRKRQQDNRSPDLDRFQAELVEQFIQNCGIYPTGSLVELSNGQVAVVTDVHSLKRLRPRVMLLLDADKMPLKQFRVLDLRTEQPSLEDSFLAYYAGDTETEEAQHVAS